MTNFNVGGDLTINRLGFGAMRHIGLSEVDVDQLDAAQKITPIVIPWFPLAAGPLAAPDSPLQKLAAKHHATPSQLALAWLLKRSPVMLPIPGTSKVAHLEVREGRALSAE